MPTGPNYAGVLEPRPTWGAGPSYRPPLGLPPGSVRGLMAVLIGGLFWALLLFSERAQEIPLFLYFLLSLLLLFFIAHGKSIGPAATGHPSPWWLPRGFFRWLIVLGFVATLAWEWYEDPQLLLRRLTPSALQLEHWPYLLLAAGAGFLAGQLLRLGPWERSYWFQDVQAWISILAMLGLGVEILLVAFVQPSLDKTYNLAVWEYVLTGIVFAYFSTRC